MFKWLNYLLLAYGLRLGPSCRTVRYVNVVLKTLVCLGLLDMIVGMALLYAKIPNRIFSLVATVVRFMSATIMFATMFFQAQKIDNLIGNVQQLIASKQLQRHVRRVDIVLMLVVILKLLLTFCLLLFVILKAGGIAPMTESFFGTKSNTIIYVIMVPFGWIGVGIPFVVPTFYAYVQYCLAKVAQSVKQSVRQVTVVTETSTRQVIYLYATSNKLRAQTNYLLGPIPFAVAAQAFLTLTSLLSDSALNSLSYSKTGFNLLVIIDALLTITMTCEMIMIADHATNCMKQVREAMLDLIEKVSITQSKDEKVRNAVRDIHAELIARPVVPPTGWDFYVLEKSFIIRFMGALVPFTLMMVTTVDQLRTMRIKMLQALNGTNY